MPDNKLYIPGKDGLQERSPIAEAVATHHLVVVMDGTSVVVLQGEVIANFDMLGQTLPMGAKMDLMAQYITTVAAAVAPAFGDNFKLGIVGNPSGVAAMNARLKPAAVAANVTVDEVPGGDEDEETVH